MWTVPCYILQGMAPDEYKWEKLFPFFSAKGSTVLILVSLDEGNCVNPVFLFKSSYKWTILIPGLLIILTVFSGLGPVFGFNVGFCIEIL